MPPTKMKHTYLFISSAQNVCPLLTKFGITQQIVIKISNTEFQENLTSCSRGDTFCHTDLTKLAGVFRNYANDLVTPQSFGVSAVPMG